MKNLICIFLLITTLNLRAQDSTQFYKQAFERLDSMLTGKAELDFKKAVFIVENAYFDNEMYYPRFEDKVRKVVDIVEIVKNSNPIEHIDGNKNEILVNASIYKVMTDTIPILLDTANFVVSHPFLYDFEDSWGKQEWSNTFVTKLLLTKTGNCHSLPFMYKILAEEFSVSAYLAFAPNHIYIKNYNTSSGWYNTELTSGTFPVDAWLMASGYVHIDAIRNGLYMDTLSLEQSVAYCYLDLAQGYQKKFGKENPDFVVECCNKVLEHHPVNVNAMLTKAEAQKHYIDSKMKKESVQSPDKLFSNGKIKAMYSDMEQTYVQLHQLGYRRMPEEMYLEWMGMLNSEPDTYQNKQVINKFQN